MRTAYEAGMTPGPESDNTGFLNDAYEHADGWLHFPAGTWRFATRPNVLTRPFKITGEGINQTTILRDYSESNYKYALFHAKGKLDLHNMAIHAGVDTHWGGAVRLESHGASGSTLSNLYITGKGSGVPGEVLGTWGIPLVITAQPVDSPIGIRELRLDNIKLFAADYLRAAWLVNVHGCVAIGVNAMSSGDTYQSEVMIQTQNGGECGNIVWLTSYLERLVLRGGVKNLTLIHIGNTAVDADFGSSFRAYPPSA